MKTKLLTLCILLLCFSISSFAEIPITTKSGLKTDIITTFSQSDYDIGKGEQQEKNYWKISTDLYYLAQLIINNPDRLFIVNVTGITDNETYNKEKYSTINAVLNYALGLWRIDDFTTRFKPVLKDNSAHNYIIVIASEHNTTAIDGKLRNFTIEVKEVTVGVSSSLDEQLLKPEVMAWIDARIAAQPKPEPLVNSNYQVGIGVTSGFFGVAMFAQSHMQFDKWNIQVFGGYEISSRSILDPRVNEKVESRARFGGFSLNYLLFPKANIYLGMGYEWHEARFPLDHRSFKDADDFAFHLGWHWTDPNIYFSGTYMWAPVYTMETETINRSNEFRISAVKSFTLKQLLPWGEHE